MRTSLYTIFVKMPDSDQYLLVHGYTGAIDLVKANVVKFIRQFERNDGKPTVSNSTVEILAKRGYLTDKTPEEERAKVKELAEFYQQRSLKKGGKGFFFIPAYNCNFRCPYCVEAYLSSNGTAWPGQRMTKHLVDKAYQVIATLEPQIEKCQRLGLYGGEPLMAENVEIVKYIVELGINRGHRFHAVTNGYDLDKYSDLLGKGKIEMLQITIDGPPDKHNQRRILHDGSGTFDKIASNVTMALEQGVEIGVRINTDKGNFDDIKRLVTIFQELGWTQRNNFRAYPAALHGLGKGDEYIQVSKEDSNTSNRPGDLFGRGELAARWLEEKIRNENLRVLGNHDGGMIKRFRDVLLKNRLVPFKPSFCGANTGMFLFDPKGDIYACWDALGAEHGKVGKYYPELKIDDSALANWRNRHVGNIVKCSKCKYALFCGGGCEAFAYNKNESFMGSYCDQFPVAFAKYILMAYKEFLKEQEKQELDKETKTEAIH